MNAPALFIDPTPWAVFSDCQRYRYVLAWPTGLQNDRYALFCLANPSTATAEESDPTVTRCIGYGRSWGFGWSRVVNARSWRETNPKLVPADPLAIGPDNDRHIAEQARDAGVVVCGWGKLGGVRGPAVLAILRAAGKVPMALKLNQDGSPVHPLYQPAKAQLIEVAA